MTRQLTPTAEIHRNQLRDERPWCWLFEFEVPTSPITRYRFANNVESVTFGTDSTGAGIVYSPFPITVSTITTSGEGDLTQIEVSVANVDLVVGLSVDEYDGLVGSPVRIQLVNLADIGSGLASIDERGTIQGATVQGDVVGFVVSAANLAKRKFPPYRTSTRSCRHQFGDRFCGYEIIAGATNSVGGGFNVCGKTLAACEERGADEEARSITPLHPQRFGGFPGIPRLSRGF